MATAKTGLYGKKTYLLLRSLLGVCSGRGTGRWKNFHGKFCLTRNPSHWFSSVEYTAEGEVVLASAEWLGHLSEPCGCDTVRWRLLSLAEHAREKKFFIEWISPLGEAERVETSTAELKTLAALLSGKPVSGKKSGIVSELRGRAKDPLAAMKATLLVQRLEEMKQKHREEEQALDEQKPDWRETIDRMRAEHYRVRQELLEEIGSL